MDPHVATLSLRLPSRPACRVRPEPARCRLSVVVVNYHHWQDTAQLVRQLRTSACARQGSAEVVVIDNHSPIEQVVRRLRRLPGVSLRRFGSNRGFAQAVNEGWRLSRGDWLLLLNPDVTLPACFLDEALALAERLGREQPRLGIIGLRLRNPDGSQQFSAGPFPTLLSTLARLFLPRSRRKYYTTQAEQRQAVDWVTGCCLLVRRDCLKQLGGFDRDFFLYYEDVDFCRRAGKEGWSVAFEPGLSVVHHNPLHGRQVPPHLRLITRHALLTYARKHWARWQFLALGGLVRLEAWCRRWWSRLNGRPEAEAHFAELGNLAGDLLDGQTEQAARRLRRVVRSQEGRLATVPLEGPPGVASRSSFPHAAAVST
jgi:N-acetylglucosaminyl-diphospho-decaprenol L-rhamnosyltransferase